MANDTTTVNNSELEVDETNRLISSEKVAGTTVYNRNGDSLGSIDHVMIDKITGNVSYAVMSCGGFLGMGESYSPVPWHSLVYDTQLEGYVLDTDRARLERAPRFSTTAQADMSDIGNRQQVDEYWG